MRCETYISSETMFAIVIICVILMALIGAACWKLSRRLTENRLLGHTRLRLNWKGHN